MRSQSELNEQGSSSANVSPDAGDIDYITACTRNLKLNWRFPSLAKKVTMWSDSSWNCNAHCQRSYSSSANLKGQTVSCCMEWYRHVQHNFISSQVVRRHLSFGHMLILEAWPNLNSDWRCYWLTVTCGGNFQLARFRVCGVLYSWIPETPNQCSVVSDGPPDLQRRDANMCYYFMLLFWVRKKKWWCMVRASSRRILCIWSLACLELSLYAKDALSSRSSSANQFAFGFSLSGSTKISISGSL